MADDINNVDYSDLSYQELETLIEEQGVENINTLSMTDDQRHYMIHGERPNVSRDTLDHVARNYPDSMARDVGDLNESDQQYIKETYDIGSYADNLTPQEPLEDLTASDIYDPAVVNLMEQYNGCALVHELQNLTVETNQLSGSTTPVSDYLQEEHGFGICPETGSADANILNDAFEDQATKLDELHQLRSISITG